MICPILLQFLPYPQHLHALVTRERVTWVPELLGHLPLGEGHCEGRGHIVRCRDPRHPGQRIDRLALRLGSHTGLVVVGEMGGEGRQEQLALGETPNVADTKGFAAPAVRETYTRAQQLCHHPTDPYRLFSVLRGLVHYHNVHPELQTAYALGEQLLALAQQTQDVTMLLGAHQSLGTTSVLMGAIATAHTHLTQGIALYEPQAHHTSAFLYGQDAGVVCYSYAGWTLWYLGYPAQGLTRTDAAVTLAQQAAHPFSLAYALSNAAVFHQFRREVRCTQERAEAAMRLSEEQRSAFWLAHSVILRGWALVQHGQTQEGLAQINQGMRGWRATGAEIRRPYFLALLAEVHGIMEQPEAGLAVLAEALALVAKTREPWCEPELYRLKGELLLQQSSANQAEAASCFQHAIAIAQPQSAKSWELRAATSLVKLWQNQGKRQEAYDLLAPVYGWFTEGFDTADLQDAKALLAELSEGSS